MTTHHFEGIHTVESAATDIADAVERCERALDALVRLPRREFMHVDECIRELIDKRLNLSASVAISRDADADRAEPYSRSAVALLPIEAMPSRWGLAIAVGFSVFVWAVVAALVFTLSR